MNKIVSIINNLDRRIIFLLISIAIIIPLLLDFYILDVPSGMAKNCAYEIDKLPENSEVLLSFDYDPQSKAELQPMAEALVRYLAARNHKLFFISLHAYGQTISSDLIKKILLKEFPAYKPGENFINLGFRDGGQAVINTILTDFKKIFFTDVDGKNLQEFPILKNIEKLKSFSLLINISAGFPGLKEWILFGVIPTGIPLVAGTVAGAVPQFFPYYPGQIKGLLGGIKGAAEFESLLITNFDRFKDRKNHSATKRMGPQTTAHLTIILLILIGNLTLFLSRKSKKSYEK